MINKYRVHEVAKDFDIKSNIVIDLLEERFGDKKKHMTALEEDELDVIFETFTKENQVEDLNEYFEFVPSKKKAKEEPAEEASTPEVKEEKKFVNPRKRPAKPVVVEAAPAEEVVTEASAE